MWWPASRGRWACGWEFLAFQYVAFPLLPVPGTGPCLELCLVFPRPDSSALALHDEPPGAWVEEVFTGWVDRVAKSRYQWLFVHLTNPFPAPATRPSWASGFLFLSPPGSAMRFTLSRLPTPSGPVLARCARLVPACCFSHPTVWLNPLSSFPFVLVG